MKHLALMIATCFALFNANGQAGFSKPYDFDRPGISFKNITLNYDTLVVFGSLYHESVPNLQGLFFSKLDTFGNLLFYHTAFDSLGGDFSARPHCSIHKLQDGSGYVIPASSFTRSNGILCFVNSDGEFSKVVEYPDSTTIVDFYQNIIETSSGFLVLGRKQRNDYRSDLFVMKTDKQGNKLWEKYYDNPGRQWYYGGYFQENENSIILAVSDIDPQETPMAQWKRKGILLSVDTLGVEQWRWESESSLQHAGLGAPVKQPDGNWMYTTAEIQIFPSQNHATNSTKIIVRDPDFNLLSEKIMSPASSESNSFVDILATPDGNWIAVGGLTTPPLWTQPNALAGWIYKFNDNLDSIWSRQDTVFYNLQIYTEHWLFGAIQLQSGSIVAAGQINTYDPIPGKSWGWLIKISKDGCIDTLNCNFSSVSGWENYQKVDITLYPNPTTGLVFYDDINIQWDKIEVINLQGQVLHVFSKPVVHELNLSNMASGTYIIRLIHKNQNIVKRIFKE